MLVIRKFMVDCSFQGGSVTKVAVFIGNPKEDVDPVHNQDVWFAKERGGTLSQSVKSVFKKLQKISQESMIPLPELCAYALKAAENETDSSNDAKK